MPHWAEQRGRVHVPPTGCWRQHLYSSSVPPHPRVHHRQAIGCEYSYVRVSAMSVRGTARSTSTGTCHLTTSCSPCFRGTYASSSVGRMQEQRSIGRLRPARCSVRIPSITLHVGTRNGAPPEEGGSQEIVMVPAHSCQGIIPALLFVYSYGVTYIMGRWRLMELHQRLSS